MRLALNGELRRLEQRLPFLATLGSAAPFIGLFGTVWGIMHSFASIAAANNTSLAVVAPGIAEALFATAMGLAAAIPAVVAYNKFTVEIGRFAGRMQGLIGRSGALLVPGRSERWRCPLPPTGESGDDTYKPLSEINVTPMVDVMLVLLVIFMVAAPLLTVGVPVNLPKTSAAEIDQAAAADHRHDQQGRRHLYRRREGRDRRSEAAPGMRLPAPTRAASSMSAATARSSMRS